MEMERRLGRRLFGLKADFLERCGKVGRIRTIAPCARRGADRYLSPRGLQVPTVLPNSGARLQHLLRRKHRADIESSALIANGPLSPQCSNGSTPAGSSANSTLHARISSAPTLSSPRRSRFRPLIRGSSTTLPLYPLEWSLNECASLVLRANEIGRASCRE